MWKTVAKKCDGILLQQSWQKMMVLRFIPEVGVNYTHE